MKNIRFKLLPVVLTICFFSFTNKLLSAQIGTYPYKVSAMITNVGLTEDGYLGLQVEINNFEIESFYIEEYPKYTFMYNNGFLVLIDNRDTIPAGINPFGLNPLKLMEIEGGGTRDVKIIFDPKKIIEIGQKLKEVDQVFYHKNVGPYSKIQYGFKGLYPEKREDIEISIVQCRLLLFTEKESAIINVKERNRFLVEKGLLIDTQPILVPNSK
jgi:hypothetical protein